MIITKASGEKEPFVKNKLRQSLLRSGARSEFTDQITQAIENGLTEGISTRLIYKQAYKLLSESERAVAGRYLLKDWIMELGPSGFPFERYLSEILSHQGYATKYLKK